MKNIKKLLAQQAKDVLPDDKVRENVKRELGLQETESSLAYAHGGEKTGTRGNTKQIAVIAAFLAVALFLCIFIPLFLSNKPNGPGSLGNKFEQITDADSFYAYGAASVGTLLDSAQTGNNAPKTKAAAISFNHSSDNAQIDAVNRYMPLVESLLSDGNIRGEGVAGGEGYEYGMKVVFTDLLGNTLNYTLYYNKIFLNGETDGDETEENYAIDGILLLGDGAQYPVEGNYQSETESGGAENELYFKAFIDNDSYIEVQQEYESETEGAESETEKEYVYSLYSQNKLVEKTVVEYEAENNELELKMTISKNGKKDTLTFRDGKENKERVLYANGVVNGEKIRFRVYIRQGQYHYVFEDGSSSDHGRFDEDDDEDDDDDD